MIRFHHNLLPLHLPTFCFFQLTAAVENFSLIINYLSASSARELSSLVIDYTSQARKTCEASLTFPSKLRLPPTKFAKSIGSKAGIVTTHLQQYDP